MKAYSGVRDSNLDGVNNILYYSTGSQPRVNVEVGFNLA